MGWWMCVCVCVRARARARARVRAFVRACVHTCVRVCTRARERGMRTRSRSVRLQAGHAWLVYPHLPPPTHPLTPRRRGSLYLQRASGRAGGGGWGAGARARARERQWQKQRKRLPEREREKRRQRTLPSSTGRFLSTKPPLLQRRPVARPRPTPPDGCCRRSGPAAGSPTAAGWPCLRGRPGRQAPPAAPPLRPPPFHVSTARVCHRRHARAILSRSRLGASRRRRRLPPRKPADLSRRNNSHFGSARAGAGEARCRPAAFRPARPPPATGVRRDGRAARDRAACYGRLGRQEQPPTPAGRARQRRRPAARATRAKSPLLPSAAH